MKKERKKGVEIDTCLLSLFFHFKGGNPSVLHFKATLQYYTTNYYFLRTALSRHLIPALSLPISIVPTWLTGFKRSPYHVPPPS